VAESVIIDSRKTRRLIGRKIFTPGSADHDS
jgi:hypothetical protein